MYIWSVGDEIQFLKETVHRIENVDIQTVAELKTQSQELLISIELTQKRFANRDEFLDQYEAGLSKRCMGFNGERDGIKAVDLARLYRAIHELRDEGKMNFGEGMSATV